MSRFYVRADDVKNDKIYVAGREAHHILDVMRLKKGEKIVAFDGRGKDYFGTIDDVSKKSLVIKIEKIEECKAIKRYNITLAQAVPKMDKMDYIIQKCTELGVDSIIPMNTTRTMVKLKKERVSLRRKRWQDIAQEAAKQCGRYKVTTIEDYLDFKEVLEKIKSYDLALMPCLLPFCRHSLKECLSNFRGKSILILIGPEGGFTPLELDAGQKRGIVSVTLGSNVLKCDTAAIATIAMVNYALNEI